MQDARDKDEQYWKSRLSSEQFNVCRLGGTEAPFSGEYYDNHEAGKYLCAACDVELFSSANKFDSGTGWPSFWDAMNEENVELIRDSSHGMSRTEVRCNNCGSHLGHVFDDGPADKTGKRYCINSLSLNFETDEQDRSSQQESVDE